MYCACKGAGRVLKLDRALTKENTSMTSTTLCQENFNKRATLIKYMSELSEEYFELHSSNVTAVEGTVSSIEFLRCWLSRNVPVIFKKAINHWPALVKWNYDYLISKLGSRKITVSVTPNGYADAVNNDRFMLPEEKQMNFSAFIQNLQKPEFAVYYIQKQNNNLVEEFSPLLDDVDPHISWATEAIGKEPDAVNFWMGDERAVTSLHKDHYENLYCVIKGKKEFILHPPIDVPWIPYKSYKVAIYRNVEEGYIIDDIDQEVSWSPIDPLNPDYNKYPLYKNTHMLHCTVEEGDVLYLPSLWFHHVRQSHSCIAINYWYDMDFDSKYCYFQLLQKMGHWIQD